MLKVPNDSRPSKLSARNGNEFVLATRSWRKWSGNMEIHAEHQLPAIFFSTENECSNYNLLDESDRSEKYQSTGAYKCDHWVHHFKSNRWNRFEGAAGETMAVRPVPPNKCSAFLSGWMDGKHPEVGDVRLETGKRQTNI